MTAILGAMEPEIKSVKAALTSPESGMWAGRKFVEGELAGQRVVVTRTGVGKVMAAMASQWVIDRFAPDAIIFVGIAGSLDSSLKLGDIVLGESTIQYDVDATALGFARGEIPYTPFRTIAADPMLLAVARTFRCDQAVVSGRILTGDRFVADKTSSKNLWDSLNGTAVEMEGGAVALTAAVNEIPHLVVRIVSDGADGNAPTDFAGFLGNAGERLLSVVKHILGNAGHS